MAPRNSDASTSYKKKNNFAVEDNSDVNVKDFVPCLLHKKHKVVKLVKTQMQKIQDEGFLCGRELLAAGAELFDEEETSDGPHRLRRSPSLTSEHVNYGHAFMCWSFLLLLIVLFLLILLMVWISAGPLSNSLAHTPVPAGSFVRTEGLCSLERKYLLRWSKPQYFE